MNRFNDINKSKREEIKKQIKQFLSTGKKIEKIEFGVSAEIPKRVFDTVDFELIEIVEEIKNGA